MCKVEQCRPAKMYAHATSTECMRGKHSSMTQYSLLSSLVDELVHVRANVTLYCVLDFAATHTKHLSQQSVVNLTLQIASKVSVQQFAYFLILASVDELARRPVRRLLPSGATEFGVLFALELLVVLGPYTRLWIGVRFLHHGHQHHGQVAVRLNVRDFLL